MIRNGLKLWTNNEDRFGQAVKIYRENIIDFIEIYFNDFQPVNYSALKILRGIPVNIHAPDNKGFENFRMGNSEISVWKEIKKIAGFFDSKNIIVHPGREHSFESFKLNLDKIDDSRILIENMPGLDTLGQPMYSQTLEELIKIKKYKNICFDFEKAIKSARYQQIDYKKFISECLEKLNPFYFHISGGDKNDPRDEHKDLWNTNFDIGWIKRKLLDIPDNKDIFLVFETPKNGENLENDIKNTEYFKNL